ncbi:MAG: Bug family tripartite tricarboxylate transporter substrate binding protein [Gemmatimonas sp.]
MIVRVAVLAFAVLAAADAALAEDAAAFYKDRQVRFVIATAAGGDYDLWGRAIGRHLGDHLFGATIVPQNMPGAGGITAANHLFNVAPKDGSTIGMIGRNLPNQAVLKLPTVKFDPARFNWIGSPEYVNRVCVAMDTAPVKTANDLLGTDLVVGGAGAGTAVSTVPLLLRNLLGLRFNVVEGYGSSTAVVLAMERGEVHGICQTVNALRTSRPGWIESGRLRVLFNVERDPVPALGAPSVYEFAKTDEQRQILDFYSSSVELGRPMVAPPDVPADRVAALRRAFDATMTDPAFLDEARRLGVEINARSGERLAAIVADLMKTPLAVTEKTEAMTQR